jgi:methylisocitrate lyase
MTEFGKTPYISLQQFESAGYNCVIYPVSTLRIASRAIDDFLKQLKQDGS